MIDTSNFPDYPFTPKRFDRGDGIHMSYLDEGPADGPVVLMLHGNPSWSYYWRKLVLGLRDRYRCIVPDHVGMGLSDKPHDRKQRYTYTLKWRVEDLTRLVENLNYSAERLMVVWPARFPTYAKAQQFAGNPEKLANEVYGGRMGNDSPGDGWRFRGRGPIQLTGRYNYTQFATATDDDTPLTTPGLLCEPVYGALSACWYFVTRTTPRADIETVTREVNGGLHGLADRRRRYERARTALEA